MHPKAARLTTAEVHFGRLNPLPELGHGADLSGNMLIHGDNLSALRALARTHAEQIQCIYIDPPYNTGHAFAHYNDDLAHQAWLEMMRPRLEAMRLLLKPGGYFFVSIDDANMAYLKLLCDQVFGRMNFVGNLIWEKKRKPSFLSHLAGITEFILVYAKDRSEAKPLYYGTTTEGKKYPINNAGNGISILEFPAGVVEMTFPDQRIAAQDMSEGRIVTRLLDDVQVVGGRNQNAFRLEGEFRYSQRKLNEIIRSGDPLRIARMPFRPNHIRSGGEPKKMKNLLSTAHYGLPTYEDAAEESRLLFGEETFDYPKPEGLILALIEASSKSGDWVLDAFAGSGTTTAVAHKAGRRWIGIERGSHIYSHCRNRMQRICQGLENGGVTSQTKWSGGGGFGFWQIED